MTKYLLTGALSLVVTLSGFVSTAFAQTEPPIQFSEKTLSCVTAALPGVDIAKIDPTTLPDDTIAKLDACFDPIQPGSNSGPNGQPQGQAVGQNQPPRPVNVKWAPPTEKCLVGLYGTIEAANAEFAKQYSKEELKAFRNKVDVCFGEKVGIGKPPEGIQEFQACVAGAVGQATADELFATFTPPDPESETGKKIAAAGCASKMRLNVGGGAQLPPEVATCFKKNGFDIETQVIEDIGGEARVHELHRLCDLRDPNAGPEGTDPETAQKIIACLKEKGIDPQQAARGAGEGIVSETETAAFEECGKKFGGFRPIGPGGPGAPGLPASVKACLEKNGVKLQVPPPGQPRPNGQPGQPGPNQPGPNQPGRGPAQPPQQQSVIPSWLSVGIAYAQEGPVGPPVQGQPAPDGQVQAPPVGNQPPGGPGLGAPPPNSEIAQKAQACFGDPNKDKGDAKRKECEQEAGVKPEPGKPLSKEAADKIRECFKRLGIGAFGEPGPNGPQGGPQCGPPPEGQKDPKAPAVKGAKLAQAEPPKAPGLFNRFFGGPKGPEGQPPQGQPGQPGQGGPNCGPNQGQPGPNGPHNAQHNNQPAQGGANCGPGNPGPQQPGPGQPEVKGISLVQVPNGPQGQPGPNNGPQGPAPDGRRLENQPPQGQSNNPGGQLGQPGQPGQGGPNCGPGNPGPGQPGPNGPQNFQNQPNNSGPQGQNFQANLTPDIRECAKGLGLNPEDKNPEVRRQIDEKCRKFGPGAPGQPGPNNGPQGPGQPQPGQPGPAGNPPPQGQPLNPAPGSQGPAPVGPPPA